MRKFITIITICIVLIMGSFIYFQKSFEYEKTEKISNAKVAMEKYLLQKGLSDVDYQLNIDYRLDSKLLGYGGYVITVIYTDEPNVTYGYDFSNGNISNKSAGNNINGDNKDFKHEK